MPSRHTDREFEQELEGLRQRLLRMSARVEEMIGRGVGAFTEGRLAEARATIALDHEVNRDELEVDELCMRLLARWQPMAGDLRFILYAVKVVTDFERIGDLAVHLCERSLDLGPPRPDDLPTELVEMAEGVQAQLATAISAFVDRDAERARAVIAGDDRIDALYQKVFQRQLGRLSADPGGSDRHLTVLNLARTLERTADHCTNLAEQVIFLVRGQDVRHRGSVARRGGEPKGEAAGDALLTSASQDRARG